MTVLEVMIKSRRADLAFRTTKQERCNQRAQDRQAHQEHRGTGKFSGKYAPQPQQTELIWIMPWGCWVELEDKDVHCKEWECTIEHFTEKLKKTENSNRHGFEVHRPSSKGAKLLLQVIKAIINQGGSGHHSA